MARPGISDDEKGDDKAGMKRCKAAKKPIRCKNGKGVGLFRGLGLSVPRSIGCQRAKMKKPGSLHRTDDRNSETLRSMPGGERHQLCAARSESMRRQRRPIGSCSSTGEPIKCMLSQPQSACPSCNIGDCSKDPPRRDREKGKGKRRGFKPLPCCIHILCSCP